MSTSSKDLSELAQSSRRWLQRREDEKRARRERLRSEVRERIHDAVQAIAPRYPGVRSLTLFGSILEPGCFSKHSDVDLAIDCDDAETLSDLWRELEESLRIPVDLRRNQGTVALAVEMRGEQIYARESAATET